MKQPVTCFFGGVFSNKQKDKINETTTSYFYHSDQGVNQILNYIQPQVIVSIGEKSTDFKELLRRPLRDCRKWLHFHSEQEAIDKIDQLYYCFVNHAIEYHQDPDLVTLFTTSYKSGDYIQRPFRTLQAQTYQHWEWIIFDDTDGDENWENLKKLREEDSRVRIYRAEKNSGVIGNMKQLASALARGAYIIELDHDDDLTPRAVELCVKAFRDFPDAGFAYSDFVEIHEDGRNFSYGDMFGLGYGSYRKEWNEDRQQWVNVCNSPTINPVTIRYLVACPNHFRAWRATTLREMGGWNPAFHVADDYEMMVRSFCHTKLVRIPENCYYQYRNAGGNNHTFIRNREIQKLWRTISNWYNSKVHQRVIEDYQQPDPFYHNYEEYRRFSRSWLHPRYEMEYNYRVKLRGNDQTPLVSVVMISSEKSTNGNPEVVRNNIRTILKQDYPELEIFVIGNQCKYLEDIINDMTHNKTENGRENNVDRIKKDLKWWNLDKLTGSDQNALNYACKLCVNGDYVVVFSLDAGQRNNFEHKYENMDNNNTIISEVIEMFQKDSELDFVQFKNSDNIIVRRDIFKKQGFFSSDRDLIQIWKDNQIKYEEI